MYKIAPFTGAEDMGDKFHLSGELRILPAWEVAAAINFSS